MYVCVCVSTYICLCEVMFFIFSMCMSFTQLSFFLFITQLIRLLTHHPADTRDVHGVKVSTRILEQMTPQEVRDLRAIFEIFDTNSDG